MPEPTQVTAKDIIDRLSEDEANAIQSEESTRTDQEEEDTPDTDLEGTPPAAEDQDEEENYDDEEEEYELPALIPEIETSPEALQRVKAFEKGIKKVVGRAKAREAELNEHLPRVKAMSDWGAQLENPETVVDAYRDLGTKLAMYHKIEPSKLLGGEVVAATGGEEDWEAMGFDSPGEYKAYKKAMADVEAKFAPHLQELEAAKAEREKAEESRRFETKIAEVADKVIRKIALEDAGWKVTKEMVAEAVKNLPQLEAKPAKAVRMWFSDQRAKHMAKTSFEQRKLPTMPGTSHNTQGAQVPKPGKVSARDVIKTLNL